MSSSTFSLLLKTLKEFLVHTIEIISNYEKATQNNKRCYSIFPYFKSKL